MNVAYGIKVNLRGHLKEKFIQMIEMVFERNPSLHVLRILSEEVANL